MFRHRNTIRRAHRIKRSHALIASVVVPSALISCALVLLTHSGVLAAPPKQRLNLFVFDIVPPEASDSPDPKGASVDPQESNGLAVPARSKAQLMAPTVQKTPRLNGPALPPFGEIQDKDGAVVGALSGAWDPLVIAPPETDHQSGKPSQTTTKSALHRALDVPIMSQAERQSVDAASSNQSKQPSVKSHSFRLTGTQQNASTVRLGMPAATVPVATSMSLPGSQRKNGEKDQHWIDVALGPAATESEIPVPGPPASKELRNDTMQFHDTMELPVAFGSVAAEPVAREPVAREPGVVDSRVVDSRVVDSGAAEPGAVASVGVGSIAMDSATTAPVVVDSAIGSLQAVDQPVAVQRPAESAVSSTFENRSVSQVEMPMVTGLQPAQVPHLPGSVSHGPYGRYLDRYRVRAAETSEATATAMAIESDGRAMGNSDIMWWERSLSGSLGFSPQTLPVNIQSLTETALSASPLVRSILTRSHVRESDIVAADSEFDPTLFLEGKFTDTSEPVGSTLTTGDNSSRYRDETYSSVVGIRKKTRAGGELEVFQRGGFQSNNSQFLTPNPQGTTRLEFNFTQPLMRDGGRAVNNTRVLLAQLELQVTNARVREELEDHLVSVTRAYWDLYLARADWLQRKRLLESAERLNRILEARDGVDSQRRQILRARAALTSRRSELVRAATRIRDIQAQLRLLTGSQQLVSSSQWELAPQDRPMVLPVELSAQQSVTTALDNRSDIAQAIRTVQAVSARVGAARNQVLPRLDLILGSYVSGLKDNRNALGAWVNQLDTGRPTYWAGLSYEIPIGNRASKARLNRNRWELSQAMYDFQQATEVVFTEVEVAVRETKTAYNEMVAKTEAIQAAKNEVEYLEQRWEFMPDPNESAVLLIEDLLDAQQRLADEELAVVTAQVSYALSWIQLRKAMGVLLRFDDSDPTAAIQPSQQTALAADRTRANGDNGKSAPENGLSVGKGDESIVMPSGSLTAQEVTR